MGSANIRCCPLLYLGFDGCLHPKNVRLVDGRHMFLDAPPQYTMFQHVALLEQLLEPHPAVRIVLSTRWVLTVGARRAAKELPTGLRARVIGTTVPPNPPTDFGARPKGVQVTEDFQRRNPPAWLAIDDEQEGWPAWALPHVVFTDPIEGISPPLVQAAIARQLAEVARKTRSLPCDPKAAGTGLKQDGS